jgi:hypothetical protein
MDHGVWTMDQRPDHGPWTVAHGCIAYWIACYMYAFLVLHSLPVAISIQKWLRVLSSDLSVSSQT